MATDKSYFRYNLVGITLNIILGEVEKAQNLSLLQRKEKGPAGLLGMGDSSPRENSKRCGAHTRHHRKALVSIDVPQRAGTLGSVFYDA